MMIMVLGGSGSGKSEYAENLLCARSGELTKYYVATMEAYGEEGHRRVVRHRRLREGKGFCTLEQSRNVVALTDRVKDQAVLLECMSNLVANEMFLPDGTVKSADAVTEQILAQMKALEHAARLLVVVSNNVFEDGVEYDPQTKEYLLALASVNGALAARAECVMEVVVGIPLMVKGSL